MPTCFVIMPITTPSALVERYGGDEDHFLHVLEFLFAPALEAAGYEAISPVASGADLIQAEIIRNLDDADLALCDMTTLNANVFFELGIRTALNKPVATVRDSFSDRIPFDHSMINCHEYRWEMDPWVLTKEVDALAIHVRACVERGGETNTLWKRLGIEAAAQVGSAGTGEGDKLSFIIRQFEDLRAEVRAARGSLGFDFGGSSVDELVIDASVSTATNTLLHFAWRLSRGLDVSFAAFLTVDRAIVIDFHGATMFVDDLDRIVQRGAETQTRVLIWNVMAIPSADPAPWLLVARPEVRRVLAWPEGWAVGGLSEREGD